MPYKDPEKRRQYHADYLKKWMLDPDHKARRREQAQQYQANLPPGVKKARWDAWLSENREAYNEAKTAKRSRYEEYTREIRRQYSLTREDLTQMKAARGGKCDICGVVPKETLHVDHDHSSGFVRGLLCLECNTGLGKFKDRIDLIQQAIRYLRRANTYPSAPEDLPLLGPLGEPRLYNKEKLRTPRNRKLALLAQ